MTLPLNTLAAATPSAVENRRPGEGPPPRRGARVSHNGALAQVVPSCIYEGVPTIPVGMTIREYRRGGR